jgi:hypothetical protein
MGRVGALLPLLPLLALAGAACSGAGSNSMAIGMNDVSILFPLPANAADIDNLLGPAATGSLGTLLPSALYTATGPIGGSGPVVSQGGVGRAAYGDLRVVAMRVDPCFASLAPDPQGAGCTAQLRLVFQEVLLGQTIGVGNQTVTAVAAFDSGLHAFYQLSRDQVLSLARALVALRVANEAGDVLGPLAPHPVMVRQGLAGPMSQGVQRLILQYAGEQNLVRAALASLIGSQGVSIWDMSAFDVGAGATVATPRTIPTLVVPAGGNASLEVITAGGLQATFGPTTAGDLDFTALGNQPAALSASARQAALDAMVRVENPKDSSPETVDCGSCHMAAPVEKFVAMPQFAFDDTTGPLAFRPDGRDVTSADMRATQDPTIFFPDLHVFSYFGPYPSISQRAVNETASVVEYLNALPP